MTSPFGDSRAVVIAAVVPAISRLSRVRSPRVAGQLLPCGVRRVAVSGSRPSRDRMVWIGAAEAHAWGEHEVGKGTGDRQSARLKPANSSGRRPPNYAGGGEHAENDQARLRPRTRSASDPPLTIRALSCGQTDPL